MSDESFLRGKAREVIRTGKMPDAIPDHVWGGRGTGVECAICGAAIGQAEMELEIEFTRGDGQGPNNYFVHLRCFSILEIERQNGANSPRIRAQAAAGRNGDGSSV
jgi:hypothetical protein